MEAVLAEYTHAIIKPRNLDVQFYASTPFYLGVIKPPLLLVRHEKRLEENQNYSLLQKT